MVRGGSGGHGRVGEGSLALRSRRQQTQGQPSQPSPVSQPPFSFYRRRKTFFIPIVPLEALSSSSAPSFKIFHGLRARTTFDPFCSTFFLKSSAVVPTTNVTEVAKLEQGRLGFSKAFSLKWPQLKKYHYNRLTDCSSFIYRGDACLSTSPPFALSIARTAQLENNQFYTPSLMAGDGRTNPVLPIKDNTIATKIFVFFCFCS